VRLNMRRSRTLGQVEATLRRHVSGNINQALERLRAFEELSLLDLAKAIRDGAFRLVTEYGSRRLPPRRSCKADRRRHWRSKRESSRPRPMAR
jgi:hypothetical protein